MPFGKTRHKIQGHLMRGTGNYWTHSFLYFPLANRRKKETAVMPTTERDMTRNKKPCPKAWRKGSTRRGRQGMSRTAEKMRRACQAVALGWQSVLRKTAQSTSGRRSAANGAIGDALNIRTAISRNWPMTTKPLTRKRRMHTQGFSQGSATAKNGNRLLYGCYMFAHKANTSDAI